MLDAGSDVKAVKVEGPPRDEIHAALGEHGQAADVTLIRDTASGTAYRYLQLKYSASNPDDGWNWSRLLARRAQTKPLSSVLGKLAGLMKSVDFKGDFAIITNQPLSTTVADDVAQLIKNEGKPTTDDKALIRKLTNGLGLTAAQVMIFLTAWDLKSFGSASRLVMESEVIQRLAGMADADARDDANLLQRRVATLMLPESRNDPAVTREVLSVWLGAGSKGMIFPAPSQIEPTQPYVHRTILDRLGEALTPQQSKPLRVHAGGGCGKTSLIWDLSSVLPEGSETFVYDCYGGGLFLASDQKRHLAEQAFTQLGNELAMRLRTPLVIRRQGSIGVLEAFRNRVNVAAGLLKLRNADARLVLCFDAVDNARTGARHWREPCFLDELGQASAWPDNVRIVLTCRTARRDDVGERHLYEDFLVPSFDVDEVRQLVASWQPEWPTHLAETFENLTGGNPRRIVYAVKGLPSTGAAEAIERLMPKAEGINPLFEQRVREAGIHLGDPAKVWRVLDALSRLPRPVPAAVLAQLAGLSSADINDIANDVGGIIERKEGWSFHDEDFEAFVVERPEADGQGLLAAAADLLLETRLTDRYAASSVAEVLVAANRLETLYALVTRDETPSEALTSLEAEFVRSRRLGLAIRCCRTAGDITNACRLLIASAEAIRRTKLLESLTVGSLNLSLRFAEDEANRLVMVGQANRSKRARLRIELASLAASTHPETAKMHLRWWHAHLGELRQDDRRNHFKVSARDIAAEYQTHSALFGEQDAFGRLFDWTPKSVLQPVFEVLAARGAGRNLKALLDAIDARPWPAVGLAPLMAAALFAGAGIDNPVIRGAFARLAKATSARWSKKPIENGLLHSAPLSWHEALLFVCERAIIHDDLKPLVAQILDRAIPPPEMSEPHHLYRLRSAGARHARAYVLRERIAGSVLPVEKWLPPRRDEPPRTHRSSSRSRDKSPEEYWNETRSETVSAFSRFVEAARVTLASVTADPVSSWEALAKALDVSRSYDHSSRRDPDAATLLMRNHLIHASMEGGDVASLVPNMRKALRAWSADEIPRAQNLASALALLPKSHDAVLELLTSLASEIKADALPASERVKLFDGCAKIALPLDPALAKWLFGEAVKATGNVDFEARSALAAAGISAEAGLDINPSERAAATARLGDAAGAVAESLAVGGDFPWDGVVGWAAAADLSMALVMAAQWHDGDIIPFSRSLPSIITAARGGLSLAQRVALTTLASEGLVDLEKAVGEDTSLPEWLLGPTLSDYMRSGDIDEFLTAYETLEEHAGVDARASLTAAKGHRDVLRSWDESKGNGQDAFDEGGEDESSEEAVTLLTTESEIRTALELQTSDRVLRADWLLQAAQRLGSIALRVPFLTIAKELGNGDGELGKAIPDILKSWSAYPPVTTWMREQFPSYIAGALSHLFRWNYDDPEVIEAALGATGLGPIAQADILLEGIERQGERISAELLYTLTGLIAARTPAQDRVGLLDSLLSRIEARTSHPPLVRLAGLEPPQDVSESVARILFTAMGDMDRRIAWRASHAALALLRAQDPAWEKLATCLVANHESVFAGPHFYRYAALEQLMTVFQRATVDNIRAIEPHVASILTLIRREPHVVLRELGRSTLLAIDAAGLGQFTEEDRTFIQQLNRSHWSRQGAKGSIDQRNDEGSEAGRKKRKYSFDTTDAIPYWYGPAARLFDMPMDRFLDRLEHWLHDKWGYGETTTHWVNEPRLRRLQGADYESTSRRHGARPTIQRLSYYLEWHAMMCVMGELISEVPLAANVQASAFNEWLSENLPTVAPYWLSDLRNPPPLEPRFWGQAPEGAPKQLFASSDRITENTQWRRHLPPDVFDSEVATSNDIVVAADFRLRWGDAVQDVNIHSAFVTPKTARSLAQALVNTRNHMDFALPEGRYHHEIHAPGFELKTWLEISNEEPQADQFDERRGTVGNIPIKPVGVARPELLTFNYQRGTWEIPGDGEIVRIIQWAGEGSASGSGWRATSSRAALGALLDQADKSLILSVEISRRSDNHDSENDDTRWLLYLLDKRGSLTSVTRAPRDLGRVLVRKAGLERSVDTLGRWILHEIADLDTRRKTCDPEEIEGLDAEIAKRCDLFRQRDHGNSQ
ncbi:hypothetical protein A6U86_29390 [Rhizobium sp. AC27/96]|nr:hypothetical protein A6U86_29390 [Rhizobium sp. AC27/96]